LNKNKKSPEKLFRPNRNLFMKSALGTGVMIFFKNIFAKNRQKHKIGF
jgi:hypothetical protein